ncbi:MAG: iron-containing alcohol dehydrogenase [Lachnospiraceae bacterium]|nr:iron-containing alcohol dehydrogenase [Lachnospiraceae bacterium]
MNSLKKIYCRAFQTVFKLALPVLPYRNPKIIGSVEKIPRLLHKKKLTRVLIVTDPGIASLGLTKELEKALTENGIFYAIYDRTAANPTTANVEEALELYHAQFCEAIIGFGGGSSMDCAKAVGARVAKPRQSLEKMKGILHVHAKLPLLIAVPTTAGTGSETTLACVIVDAETRHKYVINDFSLIPRYAVLDPNVTLSLPPFVTATTGMDALTHAVEAYIGNTTTRGTRRDAERAVKLIFENLDEAYTNGKNVKARRNMLRASYYAGCAFTKSYVGYVHAVAHSLGGQYNVPHGLANAILLPFVLEEYASCLERDSCCHKDADSTAQRPDSEKRTGMSGGTHLRRRREIYYEKLAALAAAAGVAKETDPKEEAAKAFIEAIKAMKKRFGIGDTVPELWKDDITKLAQYADKEANPLYPVPVLMDAKELERFYYKVLER